MALKPKGIKGGMPVRAMPIGPQERKLLPAPRGALFDGMYPTGAYSHSRVDGASIVQVPSGYGKGGVTAPGGLRGSIEHLENKERAYAALMKRLGPRMRGVRVLPASFVSEYQVVDGKPMPYGTEFVGPNGVKRDLYGHKRVQYPIAPALSEVKGSWSGEIAREALKDVFRSMGGLHNRARMGHGDLHGENIRMYMGKPHLSDFGSWVDLRGAKPEEIGKAIGTDLNRSAKEFKSLLAKEEVDIKIDRYIRNLKFPREVKGEVRRYLREHPWEMDYAPSMYTDMRGFFETLGIYEL